MSDLISSVSESASLILGTDLGFDMPLRGSSKPPSFVDTAKQTKRSLVTSMKNLHPRFSFDIAYVYRMKII
jgi:hypothetical protein